jgi:hypothetical protein
LVANIHSLHDEWCNNTKLFCLPTTPQFLVGEYICYGDCKKPGGVGRITYDNGQLTVTNETNETVNGSYDSASQAVYSGPLKGIILNGGQTIEWKNPSTWKRKD